MATPAKRLERMLRIAAEREAKGELVATPEKVKAQEGARYEVGCKAPRVTGPIEPARNHKLQYQTPFTPRKKGDRKAAPAKAKARGTNRKQRPVVVEPPGSERFREFVDLVDCSGGTVSDAVASASRAPAILMAQSDEERLLEFLALVDATGGVVRDVGDQPAAVRARKGKRKPFGQEQMRWGKYRGRKVKEVPRSYVEWLVSTETADSPQVEQFKDQLRRWLVATDRKPRRAPTKPLDSDPLSKEFRSIIGPPNHNRGAHERHRHAGPDRP